MLHKIALINGTEENYNGLYVVFHFTVSNPTVLNWFKL